MCHEEFDVNEADRDIDSTSLIVCEDCFLLHFYGENNTVH